MCGRDPVKLLTGVYISSRHAHLSHELEHEAVIRAVKCAFEICEGRVYILIVYFGVFKHGNVCDQAVVDLPEATESVLVIVDNSLRFSHF